MRPASVLIADSQRLFADALVAAIAQQPGLEPIREVAVTAADAVEVAERLRPDVAVVDHWIGTLRGEEATAVIRARVPTTEVLVLSGLPGPLQVKTALSAGAAGFLPKSVSVPQLAEAISRIHRGESPVFIEQLWRMVAEIDERAHQSAAVDTRLAELTEREREVVSALADGCSPRDLPTALFMAEGTARNHLHKILRKTGAETLQELLRLVRNGAPEMSDGHAKPEAWEPVVAPDPTGVSVVVADEQRLFAEGLGQALLDVHDLAVMGARYSSGVDAMHAAIQLMPRVFIYDYWMPGTSGRAVAQYLARWSPDTRVIFLSWLHGHEQVADAMWSGAAGLVSKNVSLLEMANSIRDAAAGRPLMCAAPLPRRYSHDPPHIGRDELLESLSPREMAVLQLMGEGRSFDDVGRHLGISPGTVKNHLSSTLRKTGSRTRLEAFERARRAGYVREPGAPPV